MTSQWLPNGNLLITESMRGRAFEIDQHGEIVWDYFNIIEEELTGIVEEVQRVPSHVSTTLLQRIKMCGGDYG